MEQGKGALKIHSKKDKKVFYSFSHLAYDYHQIAFNFIHELEETPGLRPGNGSPMNFQALSFFMFPW